MVGQLAGDIAEQPVAVDGVDLELDEEDRGRRGSPNHLDEPLTVGAKGRRVGAVGPVNRDAVASGDEPGDVVAGDRGAASGHLDPDVVGADDDHPGSLRSRRATARVGEVVSARSSLVPSSPPRGVHQPPDDVLGGDVPSPTAA